MGDNGIKKAAATHARRQPIGIWLGLLVQSALEKQAVLAKEMPAEATMVLTPTEGVELLAAGSVSAHLGRRVGFPVQLADLWSLALVDERRLAFVIQGKQRHADPRESRALLHRTFQFIASHRVVSTLLWRRPQLRRSAVLPLQLARS